MTSLHTPTPFGWDCCSCVSSGSCSSVYAIRPGATGDISPKAAKRQPVHRAEQRAPGAHHVAVRYGDYYYTPWTEGPRCHDAKTGGKSIRASASPPRRAGLLRPHGRNGKVFALSEDGDTFVMQAGREFKMVRKNSLGEMALATPAIAADSLILRTASRLYRISNR
jgi:hypothetical protein